MIKRVYAVHARRAHGDGIEAWGTVTKRSWLPDAAAAYGDAEEWLKDRFGKNMAIRYFARIQ